MNPFSRKQVLKGLAIAVVGYSILVLVYSNSVPHLGIEIFGRVVRACNEAPFQGLTPRPNDRVVAMGGRKIDSLPRFVNTFANLRNTARFPPTKVDKASELAAATAGICRLDQRLLVRIDFQSGDPERGQFSSWFEVHDLPWTQTAISIAWFAAESLIFWTGWLAFRRKPEDDGSALFFLMCIVTVGAYMGGYHWLRIASSPPLLLLFAIFAMAMPQVSLHFFLSFPKPKSFIARRPLVTLVWLHLLPVAFQFGILFGIGRVIFAFRHGGSSEAIAARMQLLWGVVAAYIGLSGAMFTGTLASLLHSYWTTRQPVQRNQVRWMLFGAGGSTVFISIALARAFADPVGFALGNATWAMFAASLIFAWAYSVSILKYRLLDVQDIVQRGLLYLTISFLAGVFYYGLLLATFWLTPQYWDASRGQATFAPVAVLGILILLGAIRTRFQKLVDRRFFREKSRLEKTMSRMDEAVGRLVGPKAATERGLAIVVDALGARAGAVYLADPSGLTLSTSLGDAKPPARLASNHPLAAALERTDLLESAPERLFLGDRIAEELRAHGIELVQAVRDRGQLVGAIVLSGKLDGAYESADLEVLQSFADLLGLVLSTTGAQATLEQLNEELRDKVARLSRQTSQLLALQSESTAALQRIETAAQPDAPATFPLVGAGRAMRDLSRMVERISTSPATVLIRGESGAGKSLLAEVIHARSARAKGPFVKVHCAALSPGLLESELFGHVKGSFTGAHRDKVGRFQMADGGTLFLDEIGDIPLDLQTKLLRVVQEMTFEPVGSNDAIEVDVRIVAATHQPLEELVAQRRFREDLFYRLNVIGLWLPPLRERQEDVVDLAVHFVRHFAAAAEKRIESIEDEALKLLVDYPWPGNVRELENVIERAVVMANGPTLVASDLPAELLDATNQTAGRRKTAAATVRMDVARAGVAVPVGDYALQIDEVERMRLTDALRMTNGNKSKAAALLGLPRSTFCSKLRKFGML